MPHGRTKAPPAAAVTPAVAAGAKAPRAAARGCHSWVDAQPGLLGCLQESGPRNGVRQQSDSTEGRTQHSP